MVNIIISPSQQSWNPCAQGDSEANHCFDISKRVADILRQYDCNICLIPKIPGTEEYTLSQVVTISNNFVRAMGANNPSYHLDIHTDAGGGKGASAFYVSKGGRGFVTQIWRNLSKLTPWGDGSVSLRNNLYVLNNTIATSGLIELSFHDDMEQAKWMHMNMDAIAQNLCESIVAATGIQKLDVPQKHWAEDSYQKLIAAGYKINERRFDEPLRRGEYFVLEAQKIGG